MDKVIVLGGSMGSLKPLALILNDLDETFAIPILLVIHRRYDSSSLLASAIGRNCKLPIFEPDDKMKLESGHIYLAPAGYHMLIDVSSIHLCAAEPVMGSRPSIDVLFISAAEQFRENVLGILLSGASQDGAQGAEAIIAHGGSMCIQSMESAHSTRMLEAAKISSPKIKEHPPQDLSKQILGFGSGKA